MKILLLIVALISMVSISDIANAMNTVSISSSNLVLDQGDGWALVKPNVDSYQLMLKQQGQFGSTDYLEAEQYRGKNLVAITTVGGLINSGLLPAGYIQDKLAEYGYTNPIHPDDFSQGIGPIIVDPLRVEEIYNSSSSFSSVQAESFGCSDKHRSKSFLLSVGNKNKYKNYDVNNNVTVRADIGFGATGNAEIEIFYKKDRSWLSACQTYDVDYKYHEIKAKMDFVDTSIALSGIATYQYEAKLFHDNYNLWNGHGQFWVWIVQFKWELEVGVNLDVDLTAEANATIAYEGKVNGNIDIYWKCKNADCTPMKTDVIDIDYSPNKQLLYSLDVNIEIDPKITLYVNADLDIYWGILDLVEAEVGIVLAAPLRFYGYYGNACSDANGDGSNELVKAAIVDWNAELYVYWSVGLLGSNGKPLQISLSIPGWENVYSTDTVFDDKVSILRKHLWFKDFFNPSTIFTPVIAGAPEAAPSGSLFNIKPRSCYPFNDNVKFEINWGDGQFQELETSIAGEVVSHNWSSIGQKQISVTLINDVQGRDFGSDYTTTRIIKVTDDGKPEPVSSLTATVNNATSDKKAGVEFNWVSDAHHFIVSYTHVTANGSTYNSSPYRISGYYTSHFIDYSGKPTGDVITFRIEACNANGICSEPKILNHTVVNDAGAPSSVGSMWISALPTEINSKKKYLLGAHFYWNTPSTGIPDHYEVAVSYASPLGKLPTVDKIQNNFSIKTSNKSTYVSTSVTSTGKIITVIVSACNVANQCGPTSSINYANGTVIDPTWM